MTAEEQAEVVAMYDAAGVVARELAPVIDALAALDAAPLGRVLEVTDAAVARIRRAYDAAAWVRERYG